MEITGVIILTVLFLLVCLEHIVEFVRRMAFRRKQHQREFQASTQNDGSSVKNSETDDEKHPYETDGIELILPLHRCLERSESHCPQRDRPNLREVFTASLSRSIAKVSISRPKLARTHPSDLQRTLNFGGSSYRDWDRAGLTISHCSGETIFGSPPRTSTPPPGL
ncbi:hypothetical protein ACEPAH_8597 [Sanghuangporus vaninii]